MEYTKNYHLPQWVKEDRILMEDFNQMCASIESGLTGCRTTVSQESARLDAEDAALAKKITEASREASSLISSTGALAQGNLQKGLFRLAYNQCVHLLEQDEAPTLDGIFMQHMEANEVPANSTGLELHQDGALCASSGPDGTIDALQASMTLVSSLSVVKDNLAGSSKCAISFKPSGAIGIKEITLRGSINNGGDEALRLKIRLENLTRGVREMEKEVSVSLPNSNYFGGLAVQLGVFLHGGDKYQLEMTPLNAPANMSLGYSAGAPMTILYYDRSTDSYSASLSHTFKQTDSGFGGLLLVRYAAYNKKASFTARWGGAEAQPVQTRAFTDNRGREVMEAEFRFTSAISGGSTATLRPTVQSGGDVVVYSWCAALL